MPEKQRDPVIVCKAHDCGRPAVESLNYWPLCAVCAGRSRTIALRWGAKDPGGEALRKDERK